MAKINNTEVTKRIVEDGKVSVSEGIPNQLSNIISPVLVVNPQRVVTFLGDMSTSSTGTHILYASSATKETYVTGVWLAVADDATSDSGRSRIVVTVNGVAHDLLSSRKLTTTATSSTQEMVYPVPIKIDKGSNVNLMLSFTAGVEVVAAGVVGYEVDSLTK